MKKIKKNRLERVGVMDIFLVIILGMLAFLTILPFYQVILLSFADSITYATHPIYLLPYSFDLTGYKTVMADRYFWSSLLNSLFVTVVGTLVNMYLSVTGAYVLSRKTLVGRQFFLNLVLIPMFFGGGLIPTYIVGTSLGLKNNIWCMILPTAISTYYMIIMKNYFVAFPDGLIEAAKIDGANEFQVLIKVVLPISVPFMATFALFYSVARWNEWYYANIYINKKLLAPLQIYLRNTIVNMGNNLSDIAKQFATAGKVNLTQVQMTTIVITAVPILCVYPFVQKHFVKGILVGSLKE